MSAGSGVSLDVDVPCAVQDFIKIGKKKECDKHPWIIFHVDKKDDTDAKECIKIFRVGQPGETYDDLVHVLLEKEAAYALVDYPLDEGTRKTYLSFITWTKETASVKAKMVASASVGPLKNLLSEAVKANIEGHDLDDICCENMTSEVRRGYKLPFPPCTK